KPGPPGPTVRHGSAIASSASAAAIASHSGGRTRGRRASSRAATASQPPAGGASSGSAANASPQVAGIERARGSALPMGGLRGGAGIAAEQHAQAAGAARELRLGEAGGPVHGGGDFLVGVALGVVEPQHAPGGRGQRLQGTLEQGRVGGGGANSSTASKPS